ncbi:unnamed protein product [Cyclocybe aegerita]|uniref:Uncharacterized protein n=1 Tax=Cyclocybe aegerita TaxID=1973307 RepID=A0A8S0W081_CYCAE|nr:unnamed protein product [Cyclocybe aegerita]
MLQAEGERILYRVVTDLGYKPQRFYDSTILQQELNTKFFATIVTPGREHLALYVRAFSLRALKAMKNLKFLSFGSGRPSAEFLEGCTFQLEVLRWECTYDELTLRRLLPLQRSLTHFFTENWMLFNENPVLVPTLKVLGGRYTVIRHFLPGNHIECLLWQADLEVYPVDHLALELNRLHALSLRGSYAGKVLGTVKGHLASLQILEFWEPPYAEELRWLPQIPRLEHLILSSWNKPTPEVGMHEDTVQHLFALNKVLQYVDIYVEHTAYERWHRGSIKPLEKLVDGLDTNYGWRGVYTSFDDPFTIHWLKALTVEGSRLCSTLTGPAKEVDRWLCYFPPVSLPLSSNTPSCPTYNYPEVLTAPRAVRPKTQSHNIAILLLGKVTKNRPCLTCCTDADRRTTALSKTDRTRPCCCTSEFSNTPVRPPSSE